MSPTQDSKVRLCADILPTGVQCRQIALKDQPWCHAHAEPGQRERNADGRQLIGMISRMNLLSVAIALANTITELRDRLIPPRHAQAIFDAASARLVELMGEEALSQPIPGMGIRDSSSHGVQTATPITTDGCTQFQ